MNNNAFNNRDDNTSNNIDNQNNGNVHINGNGNQVFNQVQQNFDYQKRKTSIKDIIQTTLQAKQVRRELRFKRFKNAFISTGIGIFIKGILWFVIPFGLLFGKNHFYTIIDFLNFLSSNDKVYYTFLLALAFLTFGVVSLFVPSKHEKRQTAIINSMHDTAINMGKEKEWKQATRKRR